MTIKFSRNRYFLFLRGINGFGEQYPPRRVRDRNAVDPQIDHGRIRQVIDHEFPVLGISGKFVQIIPWRPVAHDRLQSLLFLVPDETGPVDIFLNRFLFQPLKRFYPNLIHQQINRQYSDQTE